MEKLKELKALMSRLEQQQQPEEDSNSNSDDFDGGLPLRKLENSEDSSMIFDDVEVQHQQEGEDDDMKMNEKRSGAYLRFGRSNPAYLRFGRSNAAAYLRFGKRLPNNAVASPVYLRFGKRNPAYLRFGK